MKKKVPPSDVLQKVAKIFREKEERRQAFIERYGHANPPTVIKAFGNKTVSVLDGAIYVQTRDEEYNFPLVLHDHALLFFGVEHLQAQEALPLEERHPAMQWMQMVCDDDETSRKELDPTRRKQRRGVAAAWFRFAYDLYTIRDNAKLEALLKKRLINPRTFQGARYELKVAAICIAAGFELEFEDESDLDNSHVEFIAKDKFSSNRVVVEAKSRHRNNVLGYKDGTDEVLGSRVGAKNIILSAFKKKVNLPFYVFIDANLPPISCEEQMEAWFEEINATMNAVGDRSALSPANAIFFTNDPSHFITDRAIDMLGNTDHLWIRHYEAKNPRFPHPEGDMVERFLKAHQQRVLPPNEVDFN